MPSELSTCSPFKLRVVDVHTCMKFLLKYYFSRYVERGDFYQKISPILSIFDDIGTFDDMETEIYFLFKKTHRRSK